MNLEQFLPIENVAVYEASLLFAGLIGIVCYVFQSIALFKMAGSLRLKHPWMAWVPVLNTYTLGKIGSEYVKKDGRPSAKFGGWLVGFLLVIFVVSTVAALSLITMIIGAYGIVVSGLPEPDDAILSGTITFVISAFLLLALEIAYFIIYYIALWKIFAIFNEENATAFLIVSIFLSVATPFLLFAIGNKQPKIFGRVPVYEHAAEIPEFSANE